MQTLIAFLTSDTFVLSVVQSITEFLPVSSTAHLKLIRDLFWKTSAEPSGAIMLQHLALHLGTVLAIMVYYKREFISFLKLSLKPSPSQTLRLQLAVATLPMVFAGAFVQRGVLDALQNNTLLTACMLIFFGVLLYISDKTSDDSKQLDSITYKDALLIGCAQCLSLLPGVSRSGIAMTMGRFCGLQRKDATRFSLWLAVPTVLAATVWGCIQLAHQKHIYPWQLIDAQFYIAVLLTFVGGLMSIHVLISWVKTHSFFAFMVYRIVLGLVLLKTLGVI